MRSRILLSVPILVLVLMAAVAHAGFDQVTQFGTSAEDFVEGVASDGSTYYITGMTGGTLPGQTSAGSFDGFLIAYNRASDTVAWTRQFGTSSFENALDVAVSATSIVVGGGTNGVFPGETSAGGGDAYVRWYGPDGTPQLTRQFGTAGSDDVKAVATAGTDTYVYGITNGSFPGFTNAGEFDAYVKKLNGSGDLVWTRQFGSSLSESPTGIAVDATGVYVSGSTFGTLPGQTSAGQMDAFVMKLGLDGALQWTRQFGSVNGDGATDVVATGSDVTISGFTAGFVGPNPQGSDDAFIRRYTTAGAEVWTRQFGTNASDSAAALDIVDGRIAVTGSTSGSFAGHSNAGSSDLFAASFDVGGTHQWTAQIGSPEIDSGTGVVAREGAFVVGSTLGAMPGQTSLGGRDGFYASVAEDPPLANDEPASATVVSSLPFEDSIDTTTATTGADDPSCGSRANSVWYSITPSQPLRVTADTFGSDYDTILSVWTRDDFGWTMIACNSDWETSQQSLVTVDLSPQQTYYFMVADEAFAGGGNLTFSIAEAPPRLVVQLTLDSIGQVSRVTGIATVSGTITCSRPATATISGTLQQTARGGTVSGSFALSGVPCGPDGTPWSSSVQPQSGAFRPGSAQLSASSAACEAIDCVGSGFVQQTVTLKGTGR